MGGRRIPSMDRVFVARGGKIHQAVNLLLKGHQTYSQFSRFSSYRCSYFIKQFAVRPFLLGSGKSPLFHPLNHHFSHDPNHSKSVQENILFQVSQAFRMLKISSWSQTFPKKITSHIKSEKDYKCKASTVVYTYCF